jgi:hypothetical protein
MIRGQITGHSQVIPMGRPVGSTIICSHTLQDESRRFADAASLRGGEHEKRSFWRSKASTSDSSFGGNSDGQCPTPKRDAVRQAIAKQPFEQPWLGRPFVSDRCRLPLKGHTGSLRKSDALEMETLAVSRHRCPPWTGSYWCVLKNQRSRMKEVNSSPLVETTRQPRPNRRK